jgi:hypothetical protein
MEFERRHVYVAGARATCPLSDIYSTLKKRDNHGVHVRGRWARIAWGVMPKRPSVRCRQ